MTRAEKMAFKLTVSTAKVKKPSSTSWLGLSILLFMLRRTEQKIVVYRSI